MNTELIRNRAGDLNKQAAEIRGKYDFSLVKEATLKSLSEKGVDLTQAEGMLQGYEKEFTPSHAGEMLQAAAAFEKEANVLEKCADVIDNLSAKLQSSEEQVAKLTKAATVNPQLDVLKSKGGFSEIDLEALKSLPESTLNKIASSQDPWDLGRATHGQSASSVDPMVAFLLS